jgi:hypothetical protein
MAAKKTTTPAAKTTAAKKTTTPKPAAKKVAAKVAAVKKPAAKTIAAKAPAAKTPAKKAPARAVPKASPLAGMSVDDFAKRLSGWQAEAVLKLGSLVQKAAPKSTSSIKWAQPVFQENGPFAFIKPAKAHVTFGLWRGGELADPKKVLQGDGDRMKHVKLRGLAEIDDAMITAFVKAAAKLNREKGDPTKRG